MADDNPQLQVSLKLNDEISGGLQGVEAALEHFSEKVLEVAGSLIAAEKIADLFKEAITASDAIQDTTRALTTFTGSLGAAEQAMQRFEAAQSQTRSTALDLARLYTEVLPLGLREGWSQGVLQDVTVMLDQLSAKAMVPAQEMVRGFDQLLSGRAYSRNPLLQVLGLTADDIEGASNSGQVVLDRMKQLSGSVADNWQSATAKIKDAVETALGKGFMDAFGQGSEAAERFKNVFEDPQFLASLETIGKAIANIAAQMNMVTEAGAGWLVTVQAMAQYTGESIGAAGAYAPGALDPGMQAQLDSVIQINRARRGVGTSPYGLLGTQIPGIQIPWFSTGLDTSPGHDTPPTDAAAGGAGNFPFAGQTSALESYHQAIQKLLDDYKSWSAAGASLQAFVLENKDAIEKLSMQTADYGQKASAAFQQVRDAEASLRQLPIQQISDDDIKALSALFNPGTSYYAGAFSPVLGAWVSQDGHIDSARTSQLIQDIAGLQNVVDQQNAEAELKQQEANIKLLGDYWQHSFVDPMSDAFSDLATTGGKNIKEIFGKALTDVTKQAGANFVDILTKGIAGLFNGNPYRVSTGDINPATNTFYTPSEANQANQGFGAYQAFGGAITGAIGFATNASGMSPLQGALSGASIGSSIGGGLSTLGLVGGSAAAASAAGGLIGAFVGALVTALTATMPTITTYAEPVIKDGLASLVNLTGEIASDPAQQQAWKAKIQDSFDQFSNGYAEIFLSLPADLRDNVLPQVAKILATLRGPNAWTQGGFPGPMAPGQTPQSQPTGQYVDATTWNADINTWITSSMPTAIMEMFKPAFSTTFTAMGFTVDKFNEIWTHAESLDPQAALKYLNDYLTAVDTLKDLISKLSNPVSALSPNGSGLWASTYTTMNQSFVDSLAQGSQDIIDAAKGIDLLTGQSQIDQINKVNALVQQRYQLEQQYIQQLIQMVQTARDQLTGNLLQLQLNGKTPQQQYAIITGNIAQQQAAFGSETNSTTLTTDYNRIVNEIMQAAGLFPNDPSIQAWASQQLTRLESRYETAIGKFGDAIDASNQSILGALNPALTTLTTDTTTLGVDFGGASDSVAAMDAAAKSATTSLQNFGDALDSLTAQIGNAGYTSNVKRSRGVIQ